MRRLLAIFVLSCLSTLVASDLPSTPLNLSDPDVVSLLTNLQGNILQDHGRHYARHIFITFGSNSSASRWLVSLLSKHVTSAYEELHNKETDLFGSLLLSASGYEKLGVDESKIPVRCRQLVFTFVAMNWACRINYPSFVESAGVPIGDARSRYTR